MTESAPLRATVVVLAMDDLEESQAAIGVLGSAVHALDAAAYDAGYQVDLKITRLASEGQAGPA